MPKAYDALVYVGRFQPFHKSHLATVQRALELAERVVLVIGSAHRPRSAKNPFTAAERIEMIQRVLPAEDAARLVFIPMRDYFNEPRWVKATQDAVAAVLPHAQRVGLIGHFKDPSSGYLAAFPQWPLVQMDNLGGVNATMLRNHWYENAALPADLLPAAVVQFLTDFRQTPSFAPLQEEYRHLVAYRQAWAAAPYPPVFVTVDAVVTCQGRVLLIQRGGLPGRGSWAMPGGFLDQYELIAAAALRELQEETGLNLDAAAGAALLQGSAVFDHPERSERGRTITHAFHFDLGARPIPQAVAADDAAATAWVPIVELAQWQERLFDDHFVILEHFLGTQMGIAHSA